MSWLAWHVWSQGRKQGKRHPLMGPASRREAPRKWLPTWLHGRLHTMHQARIRHCQPLSRMEVSAHSCQLTHLIGADSLSPTCAILPDSSLSAASASDANGRAGSQRAATAQATKLHNGSGSAPHGLRSSPQARDASDAARLPRPHTETRGRNPYRSAGRDGVTRRLLSAASPHHGAQARQHASLATGGSAHSFLTHASAEVGDHQDTSMRLQGAAGAGAATAARNGGAPAAEGTPPPPATRQSSAVSPITRTWNTASTPQASSMQPQLTLEPSSRRARATVPAQMHFAELSHAVTPWALRNVPAVSTASAGKHLGGASGPLRDLLPWVHVAGSANMPRQAFRPSQAKPRKHVVRATVGLREVRQALNIVPEADTWVPVQSKHALWQHRRAQAAHMTQARRQQGGRGSGGRGTAATAGTNGTGARGGGKGEWLEQMMKQDEEEARGRDGTTHTTKAVPAQVSDGSDGLTAAVGVEQAVQHVDALVRAEAVSRSMQTHTATPDSSRLRTSTNLAQRPYSALTYTALGAQPPAEAARDDAQDGYSDDGSQQQQQQQQSAGARVPHAAPPVNYEITGGKYV